MKTNYLPGLILAAGLAFAGAAFAQEDPASPPAAPAVDEEVMSADDLGALSGGTGVDVDVITEQTLNAVNTGNTVTGDTVSSGEINIGANAFSGFEGVGNFVMNTGHNNNLQSTVSVSVVLAPTPTPGP
jgi:hypothetical protein